MKISNTTISNVDDQNNITTFTHVGQQNNIKTMFKVCQQNDITTMSKFDHELSYQNHLFKVTKWP